MVREDVVERLGLPENATKIDEDAYRAIERADALEKPGDAPVAYTDIRFDAKEVIKCFGGLGIDD